MPATVLRACMERAYRNDGGRDDEESNEPDYLHAAYVAYADFSTIDKRNHDAIKSVVGYLPHLHVFRTGNLDPLLDALENDEP